MTTQVQAQGAQRTNATSTSTLVGAITAMLIGAAIIVLAGHVQAATLHDAAHDVRHATGFPCH
ncbi:CbtB domain-containing protein [Pseudooceanicola aestuarii]|uniref:CbtB domain-containing protein n=1 Tax=Pseudooceanicola aestuarii TaxID=2697319 RepID=UPI0013D0AB71|nr:CbtB domain-containing protein [Pseudooceanicola aestuarii]